MSRRIRREIGEYLASMPLDVDYTTHPDCLCGHPYDHHNPATACTHPACGCAEYRTNRTETP